MSKLEQFRKQQALREQLANRPLLHATAAPEDVAALLAKKADIARLTSLNYLASLSLTLQADPNDARGLLKELEHELNQAQVSDLLGKAHRDIISAIAGPLGLGKFLAVFDKDGGNVTTVHNAQQDIYANPDKEKYNRDHYDKGKNSSDRKFSGDSKSSVGASFTKGQLDSKGQLTDGYTGETVMGKYTSPDHIVPLKTYHQDGGFMQSKMQRADFATDSENLISTQRSINSSMSADEKLVWLEKKSNGRKDTNKSHYGIDRKRVEAAVERGQATAERHAPSNSEKAAYYTTHATQTGMKEGLKMGSQQAFGMLMVELFSSALDEIKDLYRSGRKSDTILDELSERLNRVGVKIAIRWEHMLHSFSGGFISGFVSNAVTVMINLFVTTGKRAVRMIREGIFSLLKALKTFLFPPKDMTFSQAAHEALKLLAAGGVVVGGVLLEEAVEKLILGVPLFAPFAGVLTAVLVGAATALSMTFICYLLDKIDLFGAVRVMRDKQIIETLDTRIEAQVKLSMSMIEELDGYLLIAPSPA